MAETFDPKQYDRLLKKSTAEAEAYRLRTQGAKAEPNIPARQTAQKDRALLEAAAIEAASPKVIEPGSKEWEEARVKAGQEATAGALASGGSKSAADTAGLEAYTGYGKSKIDASDMARAAQKPPAIPADGVADFRKMEQEGIDTGTAKSPAAAPPATVASSAKALAGAEPTKVSAVLDKLKEEEAKGGPDFWDVIQAAAAGWGGQVPLYVQKELKRKEAETQLSQAETIAQKQAEISKAERGEEQAFERELTEKQLANALKIAGIKAPTAIGGLNPLEFARIK